MDKALFWLISLLSSVVIPIGLLGWILKMKVRSKGEYLFKVLTGYLALFALWFINNWAVFSYYLGIWWLMLPLLLFAYRFTVISEMPWKSKLRVKEWVSLGLTALLFAFSFLVIYQGQSAKKNSGEAVELEFPLKGWRYYIAHGGSSRLMNAHAETQDLENYRGQSRALDILQMGLFGNRARGIYPSDPENYHIFGQPVYAPCSGKVTATESHHKDLNPPETDRVNLAGNFVQIRCAENVYVLLAHLKQYSLKIEEGEDVETGDLLGLAGNSGNSTEPHLHIHAQSGPGGPSLLNADPLPVTFRKFGFLTRNDIVRNR